MSGLLDLTTEHEAIAQAMLETRGDLAKASRFDTVEHNAMSLRTVVKNNPNIRQRYHELLADEMQEKSLHIAERILKMAELQEDAFGHTITDCDGVEIDIPADPNTAIKLSQEISRLIAEGKGTPMSGKTTLVLASAQDAKELLASFLDS
jgi:GTPase SAR1 family protein